MKKTFIFYNDWVDYTLEMNLEEKGLFLQTILLYQQWLDVWDIWPIKYIRPRVKKQLEEDNKKRDDEIEKRREAWRLWGLSTQSKLKQTQALAWSAKANQADNVNDNIIIDNIEDRLSKDNSVDAESSKPPKEDKRKPCINEMIVYMKDIATKNGIVYSSEKEREFTNHLFSKKFKEEITDKMKDVADQKSSIERLFLMATVKKFKNGKENFRHWKVFWPKQLYDKRVDILNNYLQLTKK